MPLQTRKTTKDGRKRTYSLVSNTHTNAQAGPVVSPKTVENSSPSAQQVKGSKQALKSTDVETQPQNPTESTKQVPNVFEFLDENDESTSGSSESSSESSESESDDEHPKPPRPKQTNPKIQSPKPRANTVPHRVLAPGNSTSPNQMTQSPPASKSSSEQRKPAPPTPSQETQLVTRKRQPTRKPSPISTMGMSPSSDKGQMELSSQQAYHGPRDNGAIHRPPLPPSPPRSPEESLHRTTPTKRRDSTASQGSSGYGLLASHLTISASEENGAFPPLYRRFESVNHRVLLHLQDEISQMEEDLHTLDEYEEMHRIATAEQEGTKPLPASRRRDSQAQVYSSLHYRRMDLMAALIQKTEQYSKLEHETQSHPSLT
jgi:hypothetical protein